MTAMHHIPSKHHHDPDDEVFRRALALLEAAGVGFEVVDDDSPLTRAA